MQAWGIKCVFKKLRSVLLQSSEYAKVVPALIHFNNYNGMRYSSDECRFLLRNVDERVRVYCAKYMIREQCNDLGKH